MFHVVLLLSVAFASAPPELQFNLDLVLGSDEKQDHDLFSATSLFTVLPDERIVILDSGNMRLLYFSAKGEFLLRAGGQGEGPGEFSNPSEITCDAAGNVYVFDAQALRMSVFDNKGGFLRVVRLPPGVVGLIQPSVLPNGNILFSSVQMDAVQQQVYNLGLYNSELTLIERISARPQPVLDWNKANSSGFWVTFLKDHLESLGKGYPVATINGKGFVTMETNRYAGSLRDGAGRETGQFSRDSRPMVMSEEMRQNVCDEAYQKVTASGDVARFLPHSVFLKAMAAAELPLTLNPVARLFSHDSGFGVLHNYDTVAQRGRVELFDHRGRFLQGGTFQGFAASVEWWRNKWYTMGENEDGFQVLHRYTVTGQLNGAVSPAISPGKR